MRLSYPARLTKEAGGISVTFRDLPEAVSAASTMTQARRNAREVLALALKTRLERGQAIPAPSAPRSDEELIRPFTLM